jgi:2-polyprenyl-3-methyl-5-hydroxy-6-metoxy-1,4-benzoquinol methylase
MEPRALDLLCCPLCKGELAAREDEFFCARCRRAYPVVLGIPDFRVYSDPYIGIEEDYRKGRQVEEQAKRSTFAELLRFYWEHVSTPPTPITLRERFIRHVLSDEKRVESLEEQIGRGAACLDVGCGAGALVSFATRRFPTVWGCDVAFRWLVLARKRLEESGLAANLVCCCADFLPFRHGPFDLVTAISLLEHVSSPQEVALECGRVLKPNGRLFVFTTNRFSLAPEPHVRLWGVGFLPRRWMPAYVRWRRGLSYDKHRLLSCFDLRRIFRKAGYHSVAFSLPRVTSADWQNLNTVERAGARLFHALSKLPVVRWFLLLVSPVLQVVAAKRSDGS